MLNSRRFSANALAALVALIIFFLWTPAVSATGLGCDRRRWFVRHVPLPDQRHCRLFGRFPLGSDIIVASSNTDSKNSHASNRAASSCFHLPFNSKLVPATAPIVSSVNDIPNCTPKKLPRSHDTFAVPNAAFDEDASP